MGMSLEGTQSKLMAKHHSSHKPKLQSNGKRQNWARGSEPEAAGFCQAGLGVFRPTGELLAEDGSGGRGALSKRWGLFNMFVTPF
jgi:hypothetical protein